MGLSVGIDLGTTYSAVAVVDQSGRPVVIKNSDGQTITPSVIYFDLHQVIVGQEAKEKQKFGEENIASFFKRSMGDPGFKLNFHGQQYTPTQLSTLLLKKLKTDAEKQLGESISHAVITVPAYFNNFQREATIAAGKAAGLEVLRIINEPTSAALAYGMGKTSVQQTVLVYDLGGGTFDVSIVQISQEKITVIATDGDHELGGKDWDDRIAVYLGQEFKQLHMVDPLEDSESFQDVLTRAEEAKKQLSVREKVRVSIVHAGEKETFLLTRSQFEEMTRDLLERTRQLTQETLRDCGLEKQDITGVLLVGGSTRMPMVHRFIRELTEHPPLTGVNVDEAVALGAAIQAHIDSVGSNLITPETSSVYRLPAAQQMEDVMSHSLGMVAENEDRSHYINSILIAKNTRIPCDETRPYQLRTSASQDNTVEVYMLQGEHEQPSKCDILGKYVFSGIQHSPGGQVLLDITYSYDRNGVVTVSASQKDSSAALPLTIHPVPDDMSWLSQPPVRENAASHISIFLVIDVSVSMTGPPLEEAKDAAREFIKKCDLAHMSVGIIQFGSKAEMVISPSQNAKNLGKSIDKLKIRGSTHMTKAIKMAHDYFENIDDPRFMVILTDGMPNSRRGAQKAALAARNDRIEIITIGTGGANEDYLSTISSSDENSLFAHAGSMVETFSKIAQVITQSSGLRLQADTTGEKHGLLSLMEKL